MGLVVSRLVTGCGKIQQCSESTRLTFNKVNSVRLIETSFDEIVLGDTSISVCNLLEYFKNRKCTLNALLTIGEEEFDTEIKDIKICNKKLRVTLEKDLDIPEVCNKCISLEVFSCLEDDTQDQLKNALKNNEDVKLGNKAKRALKL